MSIFVDRSKLLLIVFLLYACFNMMITIGNDLVMVYKHMFMRISFSRAFACLIAVK